MATLMISNQFWRLLTPFQNRELLKLHQDLKPLKSKMVGQYLLETLCKNRDLDPNLEELVPRVEEAKARSLKIVQLQSNRSSLHLQNHQAQQEISDLNSFLRPNVLKLQLILSSRLR